jgi:hypothetical protein
MVMLTVSKNNTTFRERSSPVTIVYMKNPANTIEVAKTPAETSMFKNVSGNEGGRPPGHSGARQPAQAEEGWGDFF